MVSDNTEKSIANVGLAYLALALNLVEQLGLITSRFSILPNFFIQTGRVGTQTLAGFLSLILSGVVVTILWFGTSSGFNIDHRGLVLKKGTTYIKDKTIPVFVAVLILIFIEIVLISFYVSIGLSAIHNQPIWLQYSIQLLVYVFFWALLTYFFSHFLKDHLTKSKFEEDRKKYIYDLFEIIERSSSIKGDSKLGVQAIFTVRFADRLNFVVAGKAYFLVQTSYNASVLKYVLEVSKADFEIELKNLIEGGTYPFNKIITPTPAASSIPTVD